MSGPTKDVTIAIGGRGAIRVIHWPDRIELIPLAFAGYGSGVPMLTHVERDLLIEALMPPKGAEG